jgi:hypothetical protein
MKNIILIVSIFAGSISPALAQDYIIAGQTNGPNIHYTDYEPDSNILLFETGWSFLLDINEDGSNDLCFTINISPGTFGLQIWTTVVTFNDDIKIISNVEDPIFVSKLSYGDTISDFQNWSSAHNSGLMFQHYFEDYNSGTHITTGEFNDGYLGFKMIYPGETFYGWIKIFASYSSIVAMESAIYGLTVGVKDVKAANAILKFYPNPCSNELNVELNSLNNSDKIFDITDVNGNKIKSGKMPGNKTEINTSDIIPGIYFLRVMEGDKIISGKKIIKQSE